MSVKYIPPHTPLLYSKTGVCKGVTIFLIFASKHRSARRFQHVPTIYVLSKNKNQRTIGPENAHLKPDLGVLSHNEMTLTLNTHTPLLTS